MKGITDLQQTGENNWKAKYNGNYGTYTIKITTKDKKTVKFSCTCPSDYYPCKHIPMIEKAITERMAINERVKKSSGPSLEEIIKNIPAEKLKEFIIKQAKYNSDFLNTILVEFATNAGKTKGNIYSGIIQKALASIAYDEEEYYYAEECQEIDALDQWLDKAQDYVRLKQYDEAVSVCKAIIEEYSQWMQNVGEDISMFFDNEYQSAPFRIIDDVVKHIDKKELFNYCLSEMKKKKYEKTDFYSNFHSLLADLAATVDPDTFISLQDELLAGIKDKKSNEAETILRRKINFYKQIEKPKMAWTIIRENLQIESFRLKIVKVKIKKQKFSVAKKLIKNFINRRKKDTDWHLRGIWGELLLDIAQKEKDIPVVRELSYRFIKDYFNEKYFTIYKASFSRAEWMKEYEKLLLHYDNKKYFNHSVADLLATEKDTKRLVEYMEKHLSMDALERYYKYFASDYPEKTIEMFKKILVRYAENNVGRSYYERILLLLRKMSKIKGGKKAASELVSEFKTQYKNRRAMMDVLGEFK